MTLYCSSWRFFLQILVCMRQYEVPEEDLHERSKARVTCLKRILPDVDPDRLESVYLESLKKRNALVDEAWAKEEQTIHYQCVREMLLHIPSGARASLSFRLGLDVQEENVDKMLRCEAKGGAQVAFQGIQRPEFVRCVPGHRRRPHITETFDSSTVYDSPDPNQKACYNHHLGRPLKPTTISSIEGTSAATEESNDVASEEPTDQPPTAVASEADEVISTVGPTTAAVDEADTVKSE
ncbi:hypothetical protein HPB50_026903 [Hyalomma asiaticum]|uniref:Uncharacterized protein n=1 Tax=Hyalomma asiaticum TaxID=266040 RepID=A0ACB7S2H5_HYAAI|nr:hypothetical protein HPB50_026903 [Hyalomma asiaticum]